MEAIIIGRHEHGFDAAWSFIRVSAATVMGAPALLRTQASTIDADWVAMSKVARDAAYNCGKAVPDSTQIVDGWIKASAGFRGQNQTSRFGLRPRGAEHTETLTRQCLFAHRSGCATRSGK